MINRILFIFSLFALLSLTACFGGEEKSSKNNKTAGSSEDACDGNQGGQGSAGSGNEDSSGDMGDIVFDNADKNSFEELITAAKSLARNAFMLLPQENKAYETFYGLLSSEYTSRMVDADFFKAFDTKNSKQLNEILARPTFRKLRKVYVLISKNEGSRVRFELLGQHAKFTLKLKTSSSNKDFFRKFREDFNS